MAESSGPWIRYEKRGRITLGTVHSSDMLDDSNVQQFGDQVEKYLAQNAGIHLLLDFSEVEYLSSAVLSELLKANGLCKNSGGSLRLCGVSPTIYQVFQITSLEKLFAVHENESCEAALARFERSLQIADDEDGWASVSGNIE